MKPWAEGFSRGEVTDFHISRAPYTHTDGTKFEFMLVVTCEDGSEFPMRVATVQRLAELVVTLSPQRMQVSDLEAAKAIDNALAAVAQCHREIAKATAAVSREA